MCTSGFSWDPRKAAANAAKHRVTFEEATTVFFDRRGKLIADPDHSADEERWILMGRSWTGRLLVVCHGFRPATGAIRIISARRATAAERRQYGAK